MNNRTTISISIDNRNKLNKLKTLIGKIVRKSLSHDQIVSILLCTKSLDDQLIEMQLE